MLEQRIQQQFFDSADLKYQAAESLSRPIADAVHAIVGCITSGGKLMACGTGVAGAAAQHFAAQLVGRFERERPGLAALALSADAALLTAIADEGDYAQIFARQVRALGAPGDVLLVLGAGERVAAVLAAVDAAHEKDMTVIALTGHGGGPLAARLAETDVQVCVPHERPVRIQEVHQLVLHCLGDAVDFQLLGEQDNP